MSHHSQGRAAVSILSLCHQEIDDQVKMLTLRTKKIIPVKFLVLTGKYANIVVLIEILFIYFFSCRFFYSPGLKATSLQMSKKNKRFFILFL